MNKTRILSLFLGLALSISTVHAQCGPTIIQQMGSNGGCYGGCGPTVIQLMGCHNNCGYPGYHYGNGYGGYGYYNNTTGILFGAAAIVRAISNGVAANNNQPWNSQPQSYSSPAPSEAYTPPTHYSQIYHAPAPATPPATEHIPYGSYAANGNIQSPWTPGAQVAVQNVAPGTVLYDPVTQQKFLAPGHP